MSIRVKCPGCEAHLNAPDAAAGKRVKCPKCEQPVPVPAAWDGDDADAEPAPLAPLPPPTRPKVKRPKREAADEYDADERPRHRGAGLAGGLPMFGFVVIALGGLAAVGGLLWLVAGALDGVAKKKTEEKADPPPPAPVVAPPAVTWTAFVAPDNSFAAKFPNGPPVPGTPDQIAQAAGPLRQLMGSTGITSAGWFQADGNRRYAVTWLALPPAVAGQLNLGQLFAQGAAVRVGAYPAQQSLTARPDGGRTLARTLVVKNRVLTVAIDGDNTLTADDPTAVAFLNQFEVRTVPDPPAGGSDVFGGFAELDKLLKELDPNAPKK